MPSWDVLRPRAAVSAAASVNWLLSALLSILAFVAVFLLARTPEAFDAPAMRLVNSAAGRSRVLDTLLYDLDRYATFSGVVLLAIIWGLWLSIPQAYVRARLLVGTLLAFPLGVLSRFMQHVAATHPRPYRDPALHFQQPTLFTPTVNTVNSFPSDHATVFGMLLLVIWAIRPMIGWWAAAWLLIVEFARTYMGAHYPTDILGGLALAGFGASLAQAPPAIELGRRVLRLERAAPLLFYAFAFLVAYQIATLFFDVRDMVGGFAFSRLR